MIQMRSTPLDEAARRRHKLRNVAQSVILLGGMVLLLTVCLGSLLGAESVPWALAGAALGLFFSPRVPSQILLRLYRAKRLAREHVPAVFDILEELTARAGLRRAPALYYVPSAMTNAFTVGSRSDSAIALTDGMLRRLTLRELAGVLAHELSHIRAGDLWVMQLADSISRLTSMMSYAGVLLVILALPMVLLGAPFPLLPALLLVLAPLFASLLQLALSRARELDADLDAAGLTGDPQGLASALRRIERYQGRLWEQLVLPGRRIPDPSILRTHPTTEERVSRLLALVPQQAAYGRLTAVELPQQLARVSKAPHRRLMGHWY
jgi:heat shock protein HtpX